MLGINPQPQNVIDVKESYAVAMLNRAKEIAAASGSSYSYALSANLETESDSCVDGNRTQTDSNSDC